MIDLKKCPSFRLRFDFAMEIGYFESCHEPVTQEEFAILCASKGRAFSREEFQDHNRRRCCYPGPPCTYFGGMIRPGEVDAVPFVTDGRTRFHPDLPGLFEDALANARSVIRSAQISRPFLFPGSGTEPASGFVLPDFVIFHDAGCSTAHVVTIQQADDLVRAKNARFWWRQEGSTPSGPSPPPGAS